MDDSITIRCYVSGGADGTIRREDVLRAYEYLIKYGRSETDSDFYDHLLDWVQSDMEIGIPDIDECEISDWDRDSALKFLKECITSDGVHEDDEGQTHLFDPTEYEISEWELERRRREELNELTKKEG